MNPTFGFLNYGDVDVYAFKVSGGANFLRVRTETYVDTVIEVHTPSGEVLTNDDSDWDLLNGGASEVVIGFGVAGDLLCCGTRVRPMGRILSSADSGRIADGDYTCRRGCPLPSARPMWEPLPIALEQCRLGDKWF